MNESAADVEGSTVSDNDDDNDYEEKEDDDLIVKNRKKMLRRKRRQKAAALELMRQAAGPPPDTRLKNFPPYVQASDFFKGRLSVNPSVSRYTHYVATLSDARGQVEEAGKYYRQTIVMAPNDVMARNDFALHLNKQNRKEDAIKELKKAELIVSENSILHKNLGAIYGNSGNLEDALRHATRARFLAPNDAMNHRNIARIQAAMGDTHAALQHNLQSIALEDPLRVKPNTSAYRAAAVQIIAKQGSRDQAVALLDAARRIEGKTLELSTTERTYELIDRIKQSQGDRFKHLAKAKEEENAKKMASKQSWQTLLDGMSNL